MIWFPLNLSFLAGKSTRGRKGRYGRKSGAEKKEERPLPSELDTSDDDEKSISSKLGNYLDQTQSPASITQEYVQ